MATVRRAELSDREGAIRGLNAAFPPRRFEEWNALFESPWPSERPNFGYVAIADGEIVGFIASLFSTREIKGVTERFCNLSSWWVSPSYRGRGLAARLVKFILADIGDTHHLTALTARTNVRSFIESQGFRIFDDRKRLFYPRVSSLFRPRPLRARERPNRHDVALPSDQLQILDDHRNLGTRVVVFDCGGRDLLMVLRRRWVRVERSSLLSSVGERLTRGTQGSRSVLGRTLARLGALAQGDMPTCEVLYVHDPELYAPYHDDIVAYLCQTTRTAAVLADERQLARPASGGPYIPAPYYFRSKTLGPASMDPLYSEIVVLYPA